MSMLTINLAAWLLVIGLPIYGLYRGSGNLLFTGLLVAATGLLLHLMHQALVGLFGADALATSICQLVLFLACCCLAFPAGIRINRIFQVNLDPFDFVVGFLFGGVTAIVIVHFSLLFLLGTYPRSAQARIALLRTSAVQQFVKFDAWRQLTYFVFDIDRDKKREPSAPE